MKAKNNKIKSRERRSWHGPTTAACHAQQNAQLGSVPLSSVQKVSQAWHRGPARLGNQTDVFGAPGFASDPRVEFEKAEVWVSARGFSFTGLECGSGSPGF